MFIKSPFHLLPGPEESASPDGGSAGAGAADQQTGSTDTGFPAKTPVADMTPEQQAAYYLHQNRQTDNKLKGFNGFTPQDVNAMWTRLEELETERMSASDKAVKEATGKAATEAKTAAEAALRPKLHDAQFRAIAGPVLKEEEALDAVMAITDPAKFLGDDGDVDKEKVMGHLKALSAVFTGGGAQGTQQSYGHQPPAWGQASGGTGAPSRPGDAGKAAVERRHGTKTQ
jgi:hypothetical protein